tara:strand:- start:1521 stop:2255 length:735 start_codon:yes stop_codon:yes gene_type:complete
MKVVSWYSAGVTSTIATLLAIKRFGLENVEIVFFETGSHHPDNDRFIDECENLFGKEIQIMQHEDFSDIYDVFRWKQFINSPYGAPCTKFLKKRMRQRWEEHNLFDHQIFGFEDTPNEKKRAERFLKEYPYTSAIFPLIEEGLNKEDCIDWLRRVGIEVPMMYRLGYSNNNCIGCVKGGMGYWNKIRQDFPLVFEKTAELEREVGSSIMNGIYLDELEPDRGYRVKAYVEPCGIFCETEVAAWL